MAFKKIPLTIDTMIRNPVPIEGINQEDNIELNIVVTENKTPKDLSSQTIKVYVRRIDGTLVEQTNQITPTNARKGEVTVKLKNSAFNKEGYALFQLDVSDSIGRITSSYATFKIGKGLVSGEAIANTNEIEALKKVEEYIKKANQELETFKQTVAEINENEATRQENEVVRVREEASRNEAEAIRTQQEATRKEKENERVQAETKRIADEEVRRENEVLRGSKELERKQAEELRKEKELLRIADENNRKVAESKRIEAESVRVEAEKLRVTGETERVEAESLRVIAEEKRVAAETKREEGFNKFEGKINSNTKELKAARTATTGEKFNTLDGRIDCEVDRLNKKIEVSFLQQEDKESHTIENSVDGMTTDMVVRGRTLQNLFETYSTEELSTKIVCRNKLRYFQQTGTTYTLVNNTNLFIEYQLTYKESDAYINTLGVEANSIRVYTLKENEFITRCEGLKKVGWTIDDLEKLKKSCLILEGDWTNKPIPQYFEGIKSFGQQEDKISNLSNGKNLYKGDNIIMYKQEEKWRVVYIDTPNFEIGKFYKLSYSCNETAELKIILTYANGHEGYISSLDSIHIESGKGNVVKVRLYIEDSVFQTNKKFVFSNIQIEEGTQSTPYEPYKENKKDILLSQYGFDEGLRGINVISDELNSLRNVAIKRIGKREYREGDELLENIITDKTNTYYVLEEPIETPLDENINLKTFNEKTYVSFENSISGTSSFKAPVDTVVTIARLNRENRALEEENKNLRQDFESTTLVLTDSDLELVKQNVDIDFRLMEVEFALDIPQSTLSSNINFKKKGEVKSMARTPYAMMKIVILSGDYDREDYIHKVGKYYERGRMTKEEYDELMSLMTADEVIGG